MFPSITALMSAFALLLAPPVVHLADVAVVDVEVSLLGRVTESSTGRPVLGARVQIDGESAGALTNAFGRYVLRLDDTWAGREVTVSVVLLGYAQARQTVTLNDGANSLDFTLVPMANEREAITTNPGPWSVRLTISIARCDLMRARPA